MVEVDDATTTELVRHLQEHCSCNRAAVIVAHLQHYQRQVLSRADEAIVIDALTNKANYHDRLARENVGVEGFQGHKPAALILRSLAAKISGHS